MRVAAGLVGALAVAALAAGTVRKEPPPRIEEVEPWMLEALPGIGEKTRDELLREFRRRGPTVLPPGARALARRCLEFRPGPDVEMGEGPTRE